MERDAHLRTARDCLRDDIRAVPLDLPLSAAVELLLAHSQPAAPVLDDEGRVHGMLCEQDLIRRLAACTYDASPSGTVAEAMHPIITRVTPDTDVYRLAVLFEHCPMPLLPLVDESGHLLGVVGRHRLLEVLDDLRREREARRHEQTIDKIGRHRDAGLFGGSSRSDS